MPNGEVRKLDVLIIDDSPEDADILLLELRRAGLNPCHRRVDTRAALVNALDGQKWDLVLCDYAMPQLTPNDALSLVRQKEVDVPFLVVSGKILDEASIALMRSGARDIVMKHNLWRLAGAVRRELADVAGRRQAERAIRESEQRFALFMKNLPGAAWMKDLQGRYVYVNEEGERIFHMPLYKLRGKTDDEVFRPETAAQFKESDRLAVTSGKALQTIATLPQEDGLHYSIVSKFPLFGPDGQSAMVGGIAIDITDRRKAEEALRESEESYRVVAETAGDGIIKINETSRILFANHAVQDIFGYTAAELIGQSLTKLMPEHLRQVHKAALRHFIDTGTKRINWSGTELTGLHKDGRKIPLEISFGEFIKDGHHVFTGIVRDISERKRRERQSAAQHAVTRILSEFSSLSEISPRILRALGESLGWSMGAFWTVDQTARWLRCLHSWSEGTSSSEFETHCHECTFKIGIGLPGRVWQAAKAAWIPDVTRDSFSRAPFAVKEGLHAAFGFPILLGSEVLGVLEFFSREIREPDTELLQMLDVIGHQVGQFLERKRLEEQIRQAQKLESIGVLAGGVAHDFNNLLTGVMGNASLALETLSPTDPGRPFLEDVVRATENAAHLTRQLLAYAGKGRFIVEAINLSELARELTNLIQTSIPKTVHLRLELADNLPLVESDSSQLQQLIMNLVINGAEAIGEGKDGSMLVITGVQDVDETHIRDTFASGEIHPGKYVFLEVQDTGSGMDEETLAKIFDPFFTTKFSGRGLGLAAAMGIVRGHKGAMKVHSAPGRGTTFKVLLPVAAATAAKIRTEAVGRNLRGTGTILVVDDEEIVRRTATHMLKQHGYSVVLAANGKEAVDVFRERASEIILVLLDFTMPIMSGEETLRHLQSIQPNVKVLLSSGYNEIEAVQRFASRGLAGFIQKPYTTRQLAEKIKEVLDANAQNSFSAY
jgi:PAS domain S-box-containing protein